MNRVLSRSREIKLGKYDEKSSDVAEQHRLQSLQKAMAIQWLCFSPPSTINDSEIIKYKLLAKALMHRYLHGNLHFVLFVAYTFSRWFCILVPVFHFLIILLFSWMLHSVAVACSLIVPEKSDSFKGLGLIYQHKSTSVQGVLERNINKPTLPSQFSKQARYLDPLWSLSLKIVSSPTLNAIFGSLMGQPGLLMSTMFCVLFNQFDLFLASCQFENWQPAFFMPTMCCTLFNYVVCA